MKQPICRFVLLSAKLCDQWQDGKPECDQGIVCCRPTAGLMRLIAYAQAAKLATSSGTGDVIMLHRSSIVPSYY